MRSFQLFLVLQYSINAFLGVWPLDFNFLWAHFCTCNIKHWWDRFIRAAILHLCQTIHPFSVISNFKNSVSVFSCSCCHPNKFRGNKPKENLPALKRKSSSSCLIHLYSHSSGLHSASIHHLDYCVTAASGFALPLEGWVFKSFSSACCSAMPWGAVVVVELDSLGCSVCLPSLTAALQSCQCPAQPHKPCMCLPGCLSEPGCSQTLRFRVNLGIYSKSSASPKCWIYCRTQSSCALFCIYLCPGNLGLEIKQPVWELRLFHLHKIS